MSESDQLRRLYTVLMGAIPRDAPTPCANKMGEFLSEDGRVRADAATQCGSCPITGDLGACRAYADAVGASFGVWGGQDYGRRHLGVLCSEEGCEKESFAQGLCQRHYRTALDARNDPCSEPGCQRGFYARGLCAQHYSRLRWQRRKAS